ncbi:hypothetical protein DFP83_11164 [Idiomarina fontislapidosi]|uniref:hypothetical protein n=1 Tax=Idiomarina fontislapidosi TaxID=263723 RepID=UPI000D9E2C97|nr:hypothetical protein [Idiomarina fontislapidosi]PYE31193.1 hypothetical protein DFP83_11164 [Idiomarina fontislapidosi]
MNSNALYTYLYLPTSNIILISSPAEGSSKRRNRAKLADAAQWLKQFSPIDQQRFASAIKLLQHSQSHDMLCVRLQLNSLQHVLMPVRLQRQQWICGQVTINHPLPPHFPRLCEASLH